MAQRRHTFWEVRDALAKMHKAREATRQSRNTTILRPSTWVNVQKGNLVLVREAGSTLHRHVLGSKLLHEKWTRPWTVSNILLQGLSLIVQVEGPRLRTRTVWTAAVKEGGHGIRSCTLGVSRKLPGQNNLLVAKRVRGFGQLHSVAA